MSNLALKMSIKASPRDIEKLVDGLGVVPSGNLDSVSAEAVGVAAVQLLLKRYDSLADYIIDMNLYVEDAVNRRAQLVVFPAYTGLLPFCFMPQYEETMRKLRPLEDKNLLDVQYISESLALFADFVYEVFSTTMSLLAARHGVYIMAGTSLIFEEDDLRHRAFLFDDRGELVGYQDKVSLNPVEQDLGLGEGAEIRTFHTPLGAVSMVVTDDIHYYETGRIAKEQGASILLNPAVFARDYTPVDAAAGLNLRVQENRVYGVQSVLVGDSGLGFPLEGPCAIYAPNDMVRNKNGILEQGSGRFAPDILCRRLNFDRLRDITNPYTADKNPTFMDKYVDRLY
jgi:predicted amidohydrolase